MIPRRQHVEALSAALERSRIVLLVGPRQCGKTTLARQWVPEDSINYFDLENPVDLARLAEPMTALERLRGLVVIDEVQRRPDLFPVLRVLADRDRVGVAPAWFCHTDAGRRAGQFDYGSRNTTLLLFHHGVQLERRETP